jgi:hypothetical protein
VTVSIDDSSWGCTEDCEGLAFDIKDGVALPAGLKVEEITLVRSIAGSNPFTAPAFLVSENDIDNHNDLGIDISGDKNLIKPPYDVGKPIVNVTCDLVQTASSSFACWRSAKQDLVSV